MPVVGNIRANRVIAKVASENVEGLDDKLAPLATKSELASYATKEDVADVLGGGNVEGISDALETVWDLSDLVDSFSVPVEGQSYRAPLSVSESSPGQYVLRININGVIKQVALA